MFGSKDLLFSSETYRVAKSLRFRSSASAYLSRTFSTPTNNRIFTWSGWIKIGTIPATREGIFAATNAGGTLFFALEFNSSAGLSLWDSNYSSGVAALITSQVFRDPSSWYHLVMSVDTTQATASNRVRLYVNGSQITAFSSSNYAAQNSNPYMNSALSHSIGSWQPAASTLNFDGYLAEVNFIDGQALTPSSFGFYDNNGIWQPKGYTGTYGTNGFYLKFTDVGATSGANSGYGKDFSGFNTNYWTTNNFNSTSTSVSYDSMYDSPVNASNGITGIGNYCVLNPLDVITGLTAPTFSNGNLTITGLSGASPERLGLSSFRPDSGKWYFEAVPTNPTSSNSSYIFVGAVGYSAAGNKFVGSWSAYGSTYTTGTVIGCTIDFSTGNLTFYNNNVSQGAIASGVTSGTAAAIYASCYNLSATPSWDFNFGQRPFTYTPPSGFSALNTQNLSTPTITNGAAYMAAVTYTGSASTQNVTATSTNSGNNPNAVTFQPDLVWIKDRSNAQDHKWTDVVRGATKALESNTTDDEATDSNGVTAFNNNGFSLGTGTRAYSDSNGDSYIAWEWKENVSSGFDIVTYTGNGSARTISHSLNAVPNMIIVKARTTASTDQGWPVYHSANTSAPETDYLMLNTTAATADLDTVWNDTAPTSAVFSVGTNANVNANNDTYVAYLWAAIAGYSAFGSYTGNGSTDGAFVYLGFRPRFLLIKSTTLAGSYWQISDTSRDTYNVASQRLWPNASSAEDTFVSLDILSNGFKARSSANTDINGVQTYIYAAFAENPFKISRAR